MIQEISQSSWFLDTGFLQYILSPLLLAALAGIGWLSRTYLQAIRHQVENDHGTNLRADLDRIIEVVEELRELEAAKAKTMGHIETLVTYQGSQLNRLEDRFFEHINHKEAT